MPRLDIPTLPTLFAKEFFDLQLRFAERVRALTGMSLERALLEYTNLYVRLGFGRDFDADRAGWRSYVAGLQTAEDGREWTYRCYLQGAEARTAPSVAAAVGCFSYAVRGPKAVRLHFRNAESTDRSPLGASRDLQRRQELRDLFARLHAEVGTDVTVLGASWLYNLDAYRRLFPPRYSASARVVRGRYRSMTLWGQFLDHRGRLKHEIEKAFSTAIAEQRSLQHIGDCFPFAVLAVEAPARAFYEFYGLDGAGESSPR